jgi:hypothetical protein
MTHRLRRTISLLLALTAILLPACALTGVQQPTITPSVASTPAPAASPTPTRTPGPPIALLIIPADMDPVLAQAAQAEVVSLADASGLQVISQPTLDPSQLPSDLSIVIFLDGATADDIQLTLSQAPNARIVAPESDGLQPQPRLTILRPPEDAALQQAFLAGYTAALITQDYRTAALLSGSDEDRTQMSDAFASGASYYCGLCRPVRPPFESYPLALPMEPGNSPPTAALSDAGVQTVFVPSDLSDSPTLTALAGNGVVVLGTVPPPQEVVESWAASFRPSPVDGLRAAWANILGPDQPSFATLPVTAQDVNPDLLSPGRLRLVVQTQSLLADGLIDITSSP